MKKGTRTVDKAILKEAALILEKHFAVPIKIGSASFLSEPERHNALIRATIDDPSGTSPKTVIIKQSLDKKSDAEGQETLGRFARDWAGLELAAQLESNLSLVPQFYGGSAEHRFIVLEDLGDVHQSLVDALTGADKTKAEAALGSYVTSIGRLHGLSHQRVDEYLAIFRKLKPDMLMVHDNLVDLMTKLSAIFKKVNLSINQDMTREIETVFKLVQGPGPFTALIHGDICPDNVFDNPRAGQMHIIDFEWSFIGNALLDGVYMRMCMPTCWCSKPFPKDVVEKFEQLYRKTLSQNIPAAQTDKIYHESYVAACAYWMLWNVSSVHDIWDQDNDISDPKFQNLHPNWRPQDNLRRPRVLYRLQAFIEVAKEYGALPHLLSMAEQVLPELESLWPEKKALDYFPAFMSRKTDER